MAQLPCKMYRGAATMQLCSPKKSRHRTAKGPSVTFKTLGPGEAPSSLRWRERLLWGKASDKSCVPQFSSVYEPQIYAPVLLGSFSRWSTTIRIFRLFWGTHTPSLRGALQGGGRTEPVGLRVARGHAALLWHQMAVLDFHMFALEM